MGFYHFGTFGYLYTTNCILINADAASKQFFSEQPNSPFQDYQNSPFQDYQNSPFQDYLTKQSFSGLQNP